MQTVVFLSVLDTRASCPTLHGLLLRQSCLQFKQNNMQISLFMPRTDNNKYKRNCQTPQFFLIQFINKLSKEAYRGNKITYISLTNIFV